MLFLQGTQGGGEPLAVYLLNDDMEAMITQQVDMRLRDHGYTLGERADMLKDFAWLRRTRQLMERLAEQLWLLLLRGSVIGLAALLGLGIREYFRR